MTRIPVFVAIGVFVLSSLIVPAHADVDNTAPYGDAATDHVPSGRGRDVHRVLVDRHAWFAQRGTRFVLPLNTEYDTSGGSRIAQRRTAAWAVKRLGDGWKLVAPAADPGSARTAAAVGSRVYPTPSVRRFVWDQQKAGRRGIHLRSVRMDGTGIRRVYDSRRGFTTDLTLDRSGRRVAFSPCCNVHDPVLVVAKVRGGTPLKPLAHHPRIDAVGGIGWSPNGRRIAFEGTTGTYPHRVTYLWTVRPNGTGLRRVYNLGRVEDNLFINDALAWTSRGILYSDGRNLRAVKGGESRLVMRRVRSVRISGDGRWIVTERWRDGTRSVWIGSPDGTDQRRLFTQGDPVNVATFYDVTPNHDASALLAYRMSGGDDGSDAIVTWPTDASPTTSTIVDAIGYAPVATWN